MTRSRETTTRSRDFYSSLISECQICAIPITSVELTLRRARYDASLVLDWISRLLPHMVNEDPTECFALGVVHKLRDVQKAALAQFGSLDWKKNPQAYICASGDHYVDFTESGLCVACKSVDVARRNKSAPLLPRNIHDIEPDLFVRLCTTSPSSLQEFARHNEKVQAKQKTWADVAREW